jgi:hypothetical protein
LPPAAAGAAGATVLLGVPEIYSDLAGFALLLAVAAIQWRMRERLAADGKG